MKEVNWKKLWDHSLTMLYENILPDKNNNRGKDNANDEPNFEDRTCPWPYSTNNTTDNYSRGATPPGRTGRKQTLSAHCFRIPTFNSHFPSPRRMTQSNDLRRPGIWLTNCDKRRVRLNAQLLHTALLLRCFPNTQTTLAQPRRQTHALSTPRTFPPIEPAALGHRGPDSGEEHDRKRPQTGKEEVGNKEAGRFPAANLGAEASAPFLRGSEADTHLYLLLFGP